MISRKNFLRILVILVIVVLVGGGVIAWHSHNVHKAQNKSGTIPTSKKTNNNSDSDSKNKSIAAGSSQATTNSDKAVSSSSGSSGNLIVPFGSFVSNHQPSQNGSPTTEQSVCNTTPGASCDIQFTNNSGVVKSLGAQTANSSGTAYWSWNVSGGTLAPGSWKITAVAKLNGQTQSTSDPTPLEVQ